MFGDLTIYCDSLITYCRYGSNPYLADPVNGLAFIYPPVFLHFFALFGELSPYLLWTFFLGSFLFCLWAMYTRIGRWALIPMLCVGFAIKSGNIAIAMHLYLFGMFLLPKNKSKTKLKTMAVIFSLVKPYFLAYLLISPIQKIIFKKEKIKTLVKELLVPVAIVLCVYIASYFVWHIEFLNWLMRLNNQVVGMDDMGCGIVGILWRNNLHSLIFIAHILQWVLVALIATSFSQNMGEDIGGAGWVVFAVMSNPRMKDYDSFMISLCFIFGFILYIKTKRKLKRSQRKKTTHIQIKLNTHPNHLFLRAFTYRK